MNTLNILQARCTLPFFLIGEQMLYFLRVRTLPIQILFTYLKEMFLDITSILTLGDKGLMSI